MRHLAVFIACFLAWAANAQVMVDLQTGTSKSDYSFGTLGLSWQATDAWRFGVSLQNSDYRYRFIDARKVSNGYAGTYSLLAAGRIAENDVFRFDFFFKPGIRIMSSPDEDPEKPFLYDFKPSTALVLDPGFLVTMKYWNRLWLHTGINLHTVAQIKPTALLEQYPSSFLMAGASYQAGKHWTILAQAMAGPASGAGGDTEKFFWQTSVGLRYTLKGNTTASLLSGY